MVDSVQCADTLVRTSAEYTSSPSRAHVANHRFGTETTRAPSPLLLPKAYHSFKTPLTHIVSYNRTTRYLIPQVTTVFQLLREVATLRNVHRYSRCQRPQPGLYDLRKHYYCPKLSRQMYHSNLMRKRLGAHVTHPSIVSHSCHNPRFAQQLRPDYPLPSFKHAYIHMVCPI